MRARPWPLVSKCMSGGTAGYCCGKKRSNTKQPPSYGVPSGPDDVKVGTESRTLRKAETMCVAYCQVINILLCAALSQTPQHYTAVLQLVVSSHQSASRLHKLGFR